MDGVVASKEACRERVFDRGINLLPEVSKTLVGLVDYFAGHQRLCFEAGWNSKRSGLGLNKLTDIHIVPVGVVGLIVICFG